MSKKATAKAVASHQGEPCKKCLRTGAELTTPCPGYQTAGEYIQWKRQPKKARR
jgi:hypothetical protein